MLWAVLAILAAALWATSNIIQKYVLNKQIRSIVPLMILTVVGFISSLLIFLFHGFSLALSL